ncbi:PP2C family protein-serine/threonine phosphatase [Lacunimicrobium album]
MSLYESIDERRNILAPAPKLRFTRHIAGTLKERLDTVVDTMREMSQQTNPEEMVRSYGARMRKLFPSDGVISLSRRGLTYPNYRITRFTGWQKQVNPWRNPEQLPLMSGGLLSELIYSNQPHVIDQLEVDDDDPAGSYMENQKSLRAVPLFDGGEALNMVIAMRQVENGFSVEDLPEVVWISNLFGRATQNLVMAEQLEQMNYMLQREMEVVGEIQRDLLPQKLPEIPKMSLAAYYQSSQKAGGDYYDFFPLPDGKWGILIADVSGHGTPAAVVMAMTHSIAHTWDHDGEGMDSPAAFMNYLNRHLTKHYTLRSGAFVTAFYGVYDPSNRKLTYASAGHNPPRVKRCSTNEVFSLDRAGRLPMGITDSITYDEASIYLQTRDRLIFYTDGLIEAHNDLDELFGVPRLDKTITDCKVRGAQETLDTLTASLKDFVGSRNYSDDVTIIVAEVQ